MTAPNTLLKSIQIQVNGTHQHRLVEPRTSLVDFIRDELGLTGTHVGCEHGVCGACSILLDDEPVRSCLMYAVQVNGQRITTVEGLANPDGSMSVLQDSFCETHGLQCGYCTPGMVMAAIGILDENPKPTEDEIRVALEGNLCRCTGYHNIVKSVLACANG